MNDQRTKVSDLEADYFKAENADLWAMWYGFGDADELKEWGEKMERDRLAELASK
ncbi:MAG: hypothetical protein ABJF50_06985 [Paracoccaceae bacterium]